MKELRIPNIFKEETIEMEEVMQIGLAVFGHAEKLKLLLNIPNFALGNIKPVELLEDSYGKEKVINELTRINHGIFI